MPTLGIAGGAVLAIVALSVALLIVLHDKYSAQPTSPPKPSTIRKIETQGVGLRNVGYNREINDGQTILVLSGTISNDSNRALPVPKTIVVTLSDDHNNQLLYAAIPANITTLEPGESVVFRTRIHNVPAVHPHLQMQLRD